MKRILAIIYFVLLTGSVCGQYIPNNAQAFQFMPLYNPAFSGIENFSEAKLGYRYQWSGFGTYSPQFLNLSYNTRLVKPLDLAYNSLRLSDPSATDPENLPLSRRMIHGIGGNIFHSEVGVLNSVGANVHYSVHYPVGSGARLAGGVSILVENRKLNIAEVSVRDPDQFYDHLLNSSTAQTDLDVRAGVLLYSQNYYVGVSYLPLLHTALQTSDLAMAQPFYRGSLQAGVSFPINADVTLKPSIIALLQMSDDVTIDYNVKAFFRQNIWLGLGYRDIKSGLAIIGWNFNERLSASYSYEMSLGEFKQFNDGSHELVVALRFNNFRKYSQYTW